MGGCCAAVDFEACIFCLTLFAGVFFGLGSISIFIGGMPIGVFDVDDGIMLNDFGRSIGIFIPKSGYIFGGFVFFSFGCFGCLGGFVALAILKLGNGNWGKFVRIGCGFGVMEILGVIVNWPDPTLITVDAEGGMKFCTECDTGVIAVLRGNDCPRLGFCAEWAGGGCFDGTVVIDIAGCVGAVACFLVVFCGFACIGLAPMLLEAFIAVAKRLNTSIKLDTN